MAREGEGSRSGVPCGPPSRGKRTWVPICLQHPESRTNCQISEAWPLSAALWWSTAEMLPCMRARHFINNRGAYTRIYPRLLLKWSPPSPAPVGFFWRRGWSSPAADGTGSRSSPWFVSEVLQCVGNGEAVCRPASQSAARLATFFAGPSAGATTSSGTSVSGTLPPALDDRDTQDATACARSTRAAVACIRSASSMMAASKPIVVISALAAVTLCSCPAGGAGGRSAANRLRDCCGARIIIANASFPDLPPLHFAPDAFSIGEPPASSAAAAHTHQTSAAARLHLEPYAAGG